MSKTFARALFTAAVMMFVASTGSAIAAPPSAAPPPTGAPAGPELAGAQAAPPSGRAPEPPARPDGRVPVEPVAPPSPRPDGRVPIDPVEPPTSAQPEGPAAPIEPPAAPPPADGAGEQATPPDPGLPPDGVPIPLPRPLPVADAPTDSLRRLAASMDVAYNSLTVQIAFPPMGGITPTVISVGSPGPRTTQDYNGTFGFRYAFDYPLTAAGARQRAEFRVTLTEKVPGGQRYTIDGHRDLEPVFDVTLGKLTLSQTGDCDLFAWADNIADPEVRWSDPVGGIHEDEHPIHLGGNRHEVRGFAGVSRGIRAAPAFTMPTISWYESDSAAWGEFVPVEPGPGSPRTPLLPGGSRTVEAHIQEVGEDCSGLFTYDITYTPWTWASLNPHVRAPQ
jgi:hypothetical protein